MKDTWNVIQLCNITMDTSITTSITVDDTFIYFTTSGENIYRLPQHGSNTEPHILINIKSAVLCGIVWNAKNNTLYICDQNEAKHRILSYSIDTGNLATLAGNYPGYQNGNIKDALFFFPLGIAVDRNGDLYVTQSNCVQKIDLAQGIVITVAEGAAAGHRDGDAKRSAFAGPSGIAITGDDTVYVADKWNNCIRKIQDGVVSTVAGCIEQGHRDEPLRKGSELISHFPCPTAVVVDANGNLLVGDENGLWRVDLNQQLVSTICTWTTLGFCVVNQYELFASGMDCIMKIENTWKWKRWIWIGHLKENPNDCLLSTLPRDIIKLLAQFLDSNAS